MFGIYYIAVIVVILIELLLLRYVLKKQKRQGAYLNIFYIFYYIFQGILCCLIMFLDKDFVLANTNSSIEIPIKMSLLPYCIGTLLAIVGIIVGIVISNHIYKNKNDILWSDRVRLLVSGYYINQICVFLALGFSFSILVSIVPSYLISAISLTFAFSPLFVGIMWMALGANTKLIWKFVLFVTFLFHTLQGSRGLAVFPLVAFAVGYIFSISNNKAKLKRIIKMYAVIGIISIPFLGFVQDYRENFGRGKEISMETFYEMLSFMGTDNQKKNDDGIYASYGRLLNHTNNVVLVMTPYMVPYRGFDAMDQEIASIFHVLGADESVEFRKGRSDLGYSTGVATRYGFRVNEATSVEFGMFADAYSRFGYLGIFIYSILFAIVLALMEKWCCNHMAKNSLLAMMLLTFLLYNGALNYMYSYYSFFKIVLIRGMLVIVCTKCLGLVYAKR